MMKVCSRRNPLVVFEAREANTEGTRIQLIEVTSEDREPIVREVAVSTFKKSYKRLDTENAGSMRHNSKKGKAKPFIPNPYFLRQSMISQYLQCPDKFYDINENGYKEDTIFTGMGTTIHGIMEDYWKDPDNADINELFEKWWTKHAPAEQELYNEWRELVPKYFESNVVGQPKPNVIALEFEFTTEIAGIPVSGTIDRIDRINEDTIMIVDYKTNQMPYTLDELKGSVQFKLYTLALQNLKDQIGDFKHVTCVYEMLRTGQRQYITYDKEELDLFTDWIKVIWAKMLSGQDRKPKINKYCGFCLKRHKCQAYVELVESNTTTILHEDVNIDELIDEYDTLKQNIKILEGRLNEMNAMIKEKIVEEGGEVQVGGNKWSLSVSTRNTYSAKGVLDLLNKKGLIEEAIKAIPNFSANGLKKFKLSKEDMEYLEENFKQTSYTSPSLKKKKM